MTEFIFGVSAKQRSPVWSLLRVIVVLTLLLSSYAKARYLASGALLDDALLGSRSLGLFTVVFESFFAVSNDRSRPRIAAWLSIATLLCAALVTVSAAPERGVLLVDADQKIPDGATVALLPERWLGAKFPLTKLCHTEVDLSVGRFAVMLSRAGCEECRAATKKYKALAEESSARLVVLDVDNTAGVI